jgi:hypothetical protein
MAQGVQSVPWPPTSAAGRALFGLRAGLRGRIAAVSMIFIGASNQLGAAEHDHQPVAQLGAAAIIDFRAHDDRILLRFGHGREREPKFFGQQSARDLDKPQVRDVVHDPAAIGVKEHYLQLSAHSRRCGRGHGQQSL